MTRRKLSDGSSRASLIASYDYGTAFTAWGEPMAAYADVSKEERENSKTMADGSYPIKDCTGEGPTVESAVHAVGRGSGDHDAIRKHIIEASNDLKCSKDLIPDNWNSDGSLDESKTAAQLAAPPPPPVKSEAAEPPKADDAVDDEAITKAIDAAIALQEKDPDGNTNPDDEKVLAALKEAQKAQAADVAGDAKAPAEAKAPPKDPEAKNCGRRCERRRRRRPEVCQRRMRPPRLSSRRHRRRQEHRPVPDAGMRLPGDGSQEADRRSRSEKASMRSVVPPCPEQRPPNPLRTPT